MSDAPIFIVGLNSSGETLLPESLGRRRRHYMYRIESKVMAYFIAETHRFGDLGRPEDRRCLANEIGGRADAKWRSELGEDDRAFFEKRAGALLPQQFLRSIH